MEFYDYIDDCQSCCSGYMPTICEDVFGVDFKQRLSQVCGLVILRKEQSLPIDWQSASAWGNVINNTVESGGRYLTGIGSFKPLEGSLTEMGGGRYRKNAYDSNYLEFKAVNKESSQIKLLRQVAKCPQKYKIWVHTVSDMLIGGQSGMIAFTGLFGEHWDGGTRDTEYGILGLTFFDFGSGFPSARVVLGDGLRGVWGDPAINEVWGDPNTGEAWGW